MKHQKYITTPQLFFKPMIISYIFPNALMRDGKKTKALRVLNNTLRLLKKGGIVNPQLALFEALELLRIPASPCRFSIRRQTVYLPRRLSLLQQYRLVGRWIRVSTLISKKTIKRAETRLCTEIEALYAAPQRAKTWKIKEDTLSLLAQSRPISLVKISNPNNS